MSATNHKDLALSVYPNQKTSKASGCGDEENYTLTLAPLTRTPKINFGHTKVNCQVERDLLIINPQQFQVKLNVFTKDKSIDNMELTIEKMSRLNVKLLWRPEAPDNSYKNTVLFEVINSEPLKFHVNCYGECTPTTTFKKLPIRKPLSTLQPTAHDSSSTTQRKNSMTLLRTATGCEEKLSASAQSPLTCHKFQYESIYNKQPISVSNRPLVSSIYN